jgi:hypothetical protein
MRADPYETPLGDKAGQGMQRIEKRVSGGCQCGGVRFCSSAVLDNAHLCHCRMCQKAVANIFGFLAMTVSHQHLYPSNDATQTLVA